LSKAVEQIFMFWNLLSSLHSIAEIANGLLRFATSAKPSLKLRTIFVGHNFLLAQHRPILSKPHSACPSGFVMQPDCMTTACAIARQALMISEVLSSPSGL